MTLRGLFVQRWLLVSVAVLSHTSVLADPFVEKLFFKDHLSDAGSRRAVSANQDVVLECEAVGRPSPTIHWERNGVRFNSVGSSVILLLLRLSVIYRPIVYTLEHQSISDVLYVRLLKKEP